MTKQWIAHTAGPVNGEGQHCSDCGADLLYGSAAHREGQLVVRHINWRPGDPEFDRTAWKLDNEERMCTDA